MAVLGGGAVAYEQGTPVTSSPGSVGSQQICETKQTGRSRNPVTSYPIGPRRANIPPQALPGRLKFTVRRHKFNEDSISPQVFVGRRGPGGAIHTI